MMESTLTDRNDKRFLHPGDILRLDNGDLYLVIDGGYQYQETGIMEIKQKVEMIGFISLGNMKSLTYQLDKHTTVPYTVPKGYEVEIDGKFFPLPTGTPTITNVYVDDDYKMTLEQK